MKVFPRQTVLLLLIFGFSNMLVAQEKEVLDMVVASVDGEPILLSDVKSQSSEDLSAREIARKPELRAVVDNLIFQKVLIEETKERNITTNSAEVERYIQEIAKQNSLDLEEFTKALKSQGKSLPQYREEVRFEILRSKLVGELMRDTGSVSDAQIDSYLESHPELYNGEEKIQLLQVLILPLDSTNPNFSAELEKAVVSAREMKDIKILADQLQNSARISQEELLVDTSELAPVIKKAIESLETGQISEIIRLPESYAVFVPLRTLGPFEDTEDSELRDYVYSILEADVQRTALEDYFGAELLERHDIEKKL